MAHEGCGKVNCFARLLKGQHYELKSAVNVFEYLPAILKAKQPGNFRVREKHFAKLLGTKISIDSAGDYDPTFASLSEQVKTLFEEKLEEIYIFPVPLTVYDWNLVLILVRHAKEVPLMIEHAVVIEPRFLGPRVHQESLQF
ncbi:MAG: hypothetical protein WBL56_19270, partial [Candidatus Acidiferrum sp.]